MAAGYFPLTMIFNPDREQLLRALELAQVGFYDWDVVNDRIIYSPQMLKDWGMSSSESRPLTEVIKLIHPDDRERVSNLVYEAVNTHKPYATEYRVVKPDGSIVWLDVKGTIEYNEKNEAIRFFGTSVNITERKEKEQIIEESESMIRTFADAIPQMTFIADPTGAILSFNKRWYEYVNQDGTESWGWKDKPIHHPEDLERTIETWKHSLQTGEPYEIDYRLRRHDGQYRWHLGRAFPYRNKQGEIIRWYGTNTDIHAERIILERNRILYDFGFALSKGLSPNEIAEVILHEGRKILKAYGGVVLFRENDDYRIAATHEVPEQYLRNPKFIDGKARLPAKSAMKEKRFFFLGNRFELEREFPIFADTFESMNTCACVALPFISQTNVLGSVVFFLEENRIFDEDFKKFLEAFAGQAAIALDRGFLYENQEIQKDELKDALKSRDEFFSIASHELKTPLTSMRLNGQVLIKRHEKKLEIDNDLLIRFIEQNDRNVTKLVRLVDDMLDVSRIRTGRMTLRKESFDLCELLKEVVNRSESLMPVELNFSGCEAAHGFWDKLRIEQVISNLMTNAVRYGEKKPVKVSMENRNDVARISVEDQGMGIPSELREAIFERFKRGPTGDIQGLGLGLYISRHIVESHGGKIWAESEVNKGSTFFVELPLN